jgi:hypothetical protein
VTVAFLAIGVGLAALVFRKPLAKWQRDQVQRSPRNWARPFADDLGWFEILVIAEGAAWIGLGVLALAR